MPNRGPFFPLKWWAGASQLLAILGVALTLAFKVLLFYRPDSFSISYLSWAFSYGASAPFLIAFNIWLWRALSNLRRFGVRTITPWVALFFYGIPGGFVASLLLEWTHLLTKDAALSWGTTAAFISMIAFVLLFPFVLYKLHSRSMNAVNPEFFQRQSRLEVLACCVAFYGWMILAWGTHPVIYHVLETDVIAAALGFSATWLLRRIQVDVTEAHHSLEEGRASQHLHTLGRVREFACLAIAASSILMYVLYVQVVPNINHDSRFGRDGKCLDWSDAMTKGYMDECYRRERKR